MAGFGCNRTFGRRLGEGTAPFPLIGVALGGFLFATLALSITPTFWSVLTFGVRGYSG